MDNKGKKTVVESIISVFAKLALIIGVIVAFYKLPSVIADKISYLKLKNKVIKQDFTEEE